MQRRLVISAVTSALCAATLVGTATSASAAPQAVDCRKVKCVALTFDDGPVKDTQRLLGLLNDRNVRATFYAVGTNVQKNPATMRAASQAGHQIGNHSWDHNHVSLPTTATSAHRATFNITIAEEAVAEIGRAVQLLKELRGRMGETLFAYPYGDVSPFVSETWLPRESEKYCISAAFGAGGLPTTAAKSRAMAPWTARSGKRSWRGSAPCASSHQKPSPLAHSDPSTR